MDGIFHETPDNPVPYGARGGFILSPDGKRLRYAVFSPASPPVNGTVIILNGRNEVIEKYFEAAGDLMKRRFTVATFDWRGQGGSDRLIHDGHRGHVGSFGEYTRDLDQFFRDIVLPDCRGPYYILAHSTGALIALLAAPSLVNRVRRMVLIAPLLSYGGYPVSMKTIARIMSVLYWSGLGRMYGAWRSRPRPPAFEGNNLTSDERRYRRNTRILETFPKLALGGPTVAWIRAASSAITTVNDPDFKKRIKVPTLFVGAGADKVVSTLEVADYARRLRGGRMVTIDGSRHEILQERDYFREQFLVAFDAFVPGSADFDI